MLYTVECKFGKRSYNNIYVVKDENRGMYIGKRYKKKTLYKNETNILKKLNHDGIVKMVHCEPQSMFAVFEYVYGKTLHSVMREARRHVFKEYILQLIDILKYLHQQKVIYCDLKPDNIIVCGDKIKLIDFDRSLNLDDWCSYGYSMDYASCELRDSIPRCSSDVWSLGILLYEMHCGKTPFGRMSSKDTKRAARLAHIDMTIVRDPVLLDLLKKILVADHNKRATLDEVQSHPYFKAPQ